jgi:chemotaxis protein MotB
MSVIDDQKFKEAMSSLQNNLGVLEGGRTISSKELVDRGTMGQDPASTPQRTLKAIMADMKGYIKKRKLEEKVKLDMTQRGLVVRFTGQILYDIGEATIKPSGKEVLDKIAEALKAIPNNVMVEGHTDSWPIETDKFPSNWELSTTRATNLIKYFIEKDRVEPTRLSAAGYSKYRPLKPNVTAENRAKNRRVEVVILNIVNKEQRGNEGG